MDVTVGIDGFIEMVDVLEPDGFTEGTPSVVVGEELVTLSGFGPFTFWPPLTFSASLSLPFDLASLGPFVLSAIVFWVRSLLIFYLMNVSM